MQSLNIGDFKVCIANRSGTLPASILFLHGSGGTHAVWRSQMDIGYNVAAVDLPGHGNSSHCPCESIAETAFLTADILEELQLQRPVFLAGHSMGAAVTLYTALIYPTLVDGIILAGSGARLRVLPSILKSLAHGDMDQNFLRMAFSPVAPVELVEAELQNYSSCNVPTLYSDLTCCDQFDISSQLHEIQAPALIITGRDDKLTPVKYAEFLQAQLPHAQLAVVDKAGHYVMLEQPEYVNALISNFISSHMP